MNASPLMDELLSEILQSTHRYAPSLDPRRATHVHGTRPSWRQLSGLARERARDLVERGAARAGFTHRHFDPAAAARQLGWLMSAADGLEMTYSKLADAASRRALVDLLKLRVLGPYHAPLPITPEVFRHHQAKVDRTYRIEAATFEVSDPWFSPLSLYRISADGQPPITLHDHSVDLVSVFVFGQYSYRSEQAEVEAQPGDTVLDVGGCWGDTALYFASRVGATGKVYTFEFDPQNLEVLRANLALNPELAQRIEVVERALWERSGETLSFSSAGRCTTVQDGDESAELQISTVTIDDFVADAGIGDRLFIKMDVEGAELHVLRGARESLRRLSPRLAIAAYHKDADLTELPEEISSAVGDYRLYLGTFSATGEETVLFAEATARSSST